MKYSYKQHNIGEVKKMLLDVDSMYIIEYKCPEYIRKVDKNASILWKTKVDDLTINLDFYEGNIRYYDTETKIIEKESGEIIKTDERFYFHRDAYVKNEHIIIKGKEITQNLRLIDYTNDNIFFISNRCDLIKSIDINLNQQLWQYNIEDYFNAPSKILEGRVLVIEHRLVFFAHTEDWSNYATFVLDAQTGEVLFTTAQMGLKLYKYNKHIYQIQEKRIKRINPITTEIQTIELTEELTKRKLILEDKSACFYNNKLYTLAREENNDIYSIWVVINLDNETIEYQYEMLFEPDKKATDKNKMFITDIQANDKMVAVLGGNNLHIFEKEESAS